MKPKKPIKHTPGPWRIADENELDNIHPKDGDFGIWHDSDPDDCGSGVRICGIDTEWVSPEQIKANAKLIAAAPEMLEALRLLHACYDYEGGRDSKAMRIIENAITEAEGQDDENETN